MPPVKRVLPLFVIALIVGTSGFAQNPPTSGTPPFGSFGSDSFNTINLGNLNAHFTIPVFNRSGRGIPFNYNLQYDSSVWYPVGSSGNQTWTPVQNWGLLAQTAVATGYLSMSTNGTYSCYTYIPLNNRWVLTGGTTTWWWNYYVDSWGIQHPLNTSSTANWGSCNGVNYPPSQNANATATDGSGYNLQTNGYAYPAGATTTAWITTREGTVTYPPWNANGGSATFTDRNGNQITVSTSGAFTDTLGTQALAVSGSGTSTSPMVFTYPAPGPSGTGVNAAATVNYTNFTVATNFGISGIHEYGARSIALPTSIVLADGSQYSFIYEATPSTPSAGACTPLSGTYQTNCVTARLASITLPTGGTISYTYYNNGGNFPACTTGNNGVFSDGSASCLQVTTPDTTSGTKWIYTRALGTGASSTTTVTDPQGNNTVIQFQGIYETQRQTYQLISGTQTILQTINTCYNGAASPCTATAITLPITRRTELIAYPDNTGKVCKHDQFFDTYGLQTEQDDYDYGSGAPASSPMRKEITVYNRSLTNGIVSMPSSVTICNGSGTSTACTGPSGSSTGSVVAQTTYSYDQTAVVTPTGTSPQHISITGSRGNATTISKLVHGSTFLATSISYYDTGTPQTITDVNNAPTTFNYPNATSTCGNAFPTSVTLPITNPQLTRSYTYNCVGGVVLTITDENGQTTSRAFTDAYFWRPSSITDRSGAVTNLSYPTSSPYNWFESTMTVISGTSVVDVLNTVDGLGRTHLRQTRQGPGSTNFDTVETDYDSLGRVSRLTLPYTGTSGQTNSSAPATTTAYDSLGRPLTVTDAGTGSLSYTYTNNDTYISVGPAPNGENAKRRQLEYNALGQLTSVCEITSGSQSGACGQSNPATGYLTSYMNDVLGNLVGVTQNAQPGGTAQTRSYTFDALSRLTSETNPESGATTYVYDTIASGNCAGTYNGNLIERVDAIGNVICYSYDPLHRQTSVTYPAGQYASVTPNKYFVYDAATVNSVTMANAKGRLAEAYTCTTCPGTKLTDLGLSYTARGQVSDVYESTPHSGGYFHVLQGYWANGMTNYINSYFPMPNLTYNPDGEGRVNSITDSGSRTLISSTTYNAASLPTQVNFGSGDNDIFAYDSNTLRMTQFKFNIGTAPQTYIGGLTWNANGSLGQLAITDPFNGSDTQTCNYSHDDLLRIATANCSTAANQAFSYDPFGNISKSGSPYTFQPTYNSASNRFATLPGTTPSYDADGNVLSDGNHTYSWDANGRTTTLDSVSLTFDAMGRMVEQNRSGSYTQIVYAPSGNKLALMNGQSTLVKGLAYLPGGATAIYTSTGLDHYRHSDWLASARLTSSPSRAYISSVAYAPFGETYASSGTLDLSFTGQNPDTVSTDYDFLFREYSTEGRWPSPDPAGFAAVNPASPQSWNRYAYVMDNPLALIDPFGLCGGGPGLVTVTIGGVPTGPGTVFTSDACLGAGGGPGWSWPCFGFLSTGGNGPGCQKAPRPPSPPNPITGILNRLRIVTKNLPCVAALPLMANSWSNGGGSTSIGGGGSFTAAVPTGGIDANVSVMANADAWGNVSLTVTGGSNDIPPLGGQGAIGGGLTGGVSVSTSNGTVDQLNGESLGGWAAAGPVSVQMSQSANNGPVSAGLTVGGGIGGQGAAVNIFKTKTLAKTNCSGAAIEFILSFFD